MRRTIITISALVLFVLAALLVAGAREFSSKFQECQTKYDAQAGTQQQPEGLPQFIIQRILSPRCTARFIRRENAAITALATVLLAVITLALAYIARMQYVTTHAQLRAYVLVESTGILGVQNGGSPIAQVGVKNSGQTPAYNVTANLSVLRFSRYDAADTLPALPTIKEKVSGDIISPGGVRTFMSRNPDIILNKESVKQIYDGTHALFAYGEIFYMDSFGKKQTTTFRLYCGGKDISAETVHMLRAHQRGNKAT